MSDDIKKTRMALAALKNALTRQQKRAMKAEPGQVVQLRTEPQWVEAIIEFVEEQLGATNE